MSNAVDNMKEYVNTKTNSSKKSDISDIKYEHNNNNSYNKEIIDENKTINSSVKVVNSLNNKSEIKNTLSKSLKRLIHVIINII